MPHATAASAPLPRMGKHILALTLQQARLFPQQKAFRSPAAPSTELWRRDSAHPLSCHVKRSPQSGRGDEEKPQE